MKLMVSMYLTQPFSINHHIDFTQFRFTNLIFVNPFQTFVIFALVCVSMALAMPYPMPYPYPYAMPDDAYHPAPDYHPAIGRVKIQVGFSLWENIFLMVASM